MRKDRPTAKVAFLLGAGFSKAVSPHMPLLRELGAELSDSQTARALPAHLKVLLRQNPEAVLTYLAEDMPWKSPVEARRDEAAFLDLARDIQRIVSAAEARAVESGLPDWSRRLVQSWAKHRLPIVTLNYDTLVERIATGSQSEELGYPSTGIESIYQAPILYAGQRLHSTLSEDPRPTFHLLKLHGSINWYYSGPNAPVGDQVFYLHPNSAIPSQEPLVATAEGLATKDKEVMLVPPVTDKTFHYRNSTLRAIWREAVAAFRQAETIVAVGYSMPAADVAMQAMLRECDRLPGRLLLVNKCDHRSGSLSSCYLPVFRRRSVATVYVHEDEPLERFAADFEGLLAADREASS